MEVLEDVKDFVKDVKHHYKRLGGGKTTEFSRLKTHVISYIMKEVQISVADGEMETVDGAYILDELKKFSPKMKINGGGKRKLSNHQQNNRSGSKNRRRKRSITSDRHSVK